MGSVTDLLADAHRLGLTVRLDGDRLVVRGPKRAEATARLLLARKADIVDALRKTPSTVYTFAANAEKNANPVGVDSVDTLKNDFAEVVVENIEPGVDPWAEAVPWDASPPCCSVCGSYAGWMSMADRWQCLKCSPPRRAERLLRRRENILRRRTAARPQAAASASPNKAATAETPERIDCPRIQPRAVDPV